MNRQPPMQQPPPSGPPSGQPPKLAADYVDPNAVENIRGPAITLLITASIWIVLLAISFAINIGELRTFEIADMTEDEKENAQALAFTIAAIICNFIIIAGSVCMLLRKAYSFALLSLILAMIPGLSPCLLIGVALGIWAITAIRKPGVKEAFG